jgi:hypothetical protein
VGRRHTSRQRHARISRRDVQRAVELPDRTAALVPRRRRNGWYSREDAEVKFWKQANALVAGPKLWDAARAIDPSFTCANLFWWFNMYSTVDVSVTPRPMYPADGRKVPDVYTAPGPLRDELQAALGTFPLFEFWGPRASIRSTQWIAEAAKRVELTSQPTLSLVYLPHLDYNLQKVGVSHPSVADDLRAVDAVCGDLIAFFEGRGVQVVVLSEYGLCDVTTPVHLNRVLRERGLVAVRSELGHDVIDPGGSTAFAVADHQVAHVYVKRSDGAGQGARDRRVGAGRRAGAGPIRTRRPRHRSTRAAAISSRSPPRTRGSPTTTGWMTRARPTTRAPWTSTASPGTTRSNCSWIPPSRCRR